MDTLVASSLWQKVTGSMPEAVTQGKHCEMLFRDVPTELTQVEAEIGPLHEGAVPADGPQVEVHVDGQGGESRHTQPGQHEQVGQHDELQPRKVQREHVSSTGKEEFFAYNVPCQRVSVLSIQHW